MRTAVEKPGEQIYSNYTEEDFAVWKLLYEKQMHNLQGKVLLPVVFYPLLGLGDATYRGPAGNN